MSLLVVESSDGSQIGGRAVERRLARIRNLGFDVLVGRWSSRPAVVKAGGREDRPRLATNVQSALTSAGRGSLRSGAALLTGDELGRRLSNFIGYSGRTLRDARRPVETTSMGSSDSVAFEGQPRMAHPWFPWVSTMTFQFWSPS